MPGSMSGEEKRSDGLLGERGNERRRAPWRRRSCTPPRFSSTLPDRYFAQQPPAKVLLEACGSAHHWARQLQQLGHTVRLLPAHDVHRYVRRSKTDRTDAKALLEADRNEDIHAVPVKTVDAQAIASLHRLRSAWLATRTARLNGLRGLLREFGIAIPLGARHVVPARSQSCSMGADAQFRNWCGPRWPMRATR